MNNQERIESLLMSTNRPGTDKLLEHMEENGFYTASCSGKHHLNIRGGLAEHSLNVFENADKLYKMLNANIDAASIVIVSLLHDLGKMGDFGKPNYIENILKSGKVSEAEPFKTNPELLYIPHEVRSIEIAERFIKLTEEEAHAIYYHNGKYTHIGYDLKETPLQMILHFADLWSSRVTEVSK